MARSPPSDPELELWRSIRSIYRIALKRLNARLAKEKITYPQYSVLLALGLNGPMQMNRLGEHMLVAPANVTGLIDRMEKRGYVVRRKGLQDRRLYVIEITDLGLRVYRRISTRFRRYARGFGSSLSPDELENTIASLAKVRKRVDEMTEL
jgi:DNA-binding MarR family transcriptional regulator